MLSFFVISTLVLCTAHLYLFLKLRHLFNSVFWQAGLLAFFVAMLFLLIFRRRDFYDGMPEFVPMLAFCWMGFIFIAILCFASVDVARLALYLIKLLHGPNICWLLAPSHMTPLVLLACIGLAAYGYHTAHNVRTNYLTIPSAKFAPGAPPLRIAALTDLHLGHTIGPEELKGYLHAAMRHNPDIVVIVGDVLDANMSQRHADAAMLNAISSPGGKFAVLGNHEVYSGLENSRAFIRRSGLTLLENQTTTSMGINIIGMDDPTVASMGYAAPGDSVALLQSVDKSRFTLMLKHQPLIKDEEIGLIDLQISGHTHGGQIWPNTYVTEKVFGFKQGLTVLENAQGKSLLYLSNGTGYWGPPMRIGAPPEVIIFDIVPQER